MKFQISSRRENFTLSDVGDNTSRPLNKGGIADLPFLRTLLAILQKSQEPSFWEVMDPIALLAYASLAASRTLLQWLPACQKFTLDSEDLSFWYKKMVIFMNYGSSTTGLSMNGMWLHLHTLTHASTYLDVLMLHL